jgi:hypothetical protein
VRRQFHNGHRRAALRAHTAATLYLNNALPSLKAAAEATGSNIHYVRAVITLIQSENTVLLARVLAGKVAVQAAAREVDRLAKLVTAYRTAGANDHVAFAKAVGPTTLFDNSLVPAL